MTTRCADFRFATALVVTLALAFIAASITVSKTSTSGPLAAPLPRAHRCATARARVGAAPLGKKQILVGLSTVALQHAVSFPSFAVDPLAAAAARRARKARMKEKYGESLTNDERELLEQSKEQIEEKSEGQKAPSELAQTLTKNVNTLKTSKEAQRAAIREKLIASGGGTPATSTSE
ncbi:hypothetical protein AAMO2058_000149100 [Amorphochlora amoebiformis]